MKKNRFIKTNTRAVVAVALLITSPISISANYDLLDQRKNIFGNIEQNTPLTNESLSSPSILDSMQQEKINEKKRDYLNVLKLLKQNKLEEAGHKLTLLLKQYPENPELYNLLALSEIMNKDTASAEKSYQKTISIDNNNILAHLGLSKLALDTGDLVKAKEYANKVLGINNKIVNAHLLLADIAYKQKNINEVEFVLSSAHEKVKGDISAEIQVIQSLGQFYVFQKQPEKILLLSEDLVKRYPDDSKALSLLAGAQIVNNLKSLAETTLTQIINKEKQDINHRLLLAKLLAEYENKEKEVIELLDYALETAPSNPEVYVFKTDYLIKLKRYTEASELADLAEKKFPSMSVGNLLKGDVMFAEHKWDNAIDNYQKAYLKQPANKILFIIVDIMNAQKKSPDAIKLLDNELAKNSKNSEIHFKLATTYQKQNDYKQAENHYNAVLVVQPDNVLALNNLAWIYALENKPQALELAKKAYTLAPESAAIADTYGHLLVKHNQQAEGLKLLEKAANLAPKLEDIQFHLAEAYAANNQQAKAIEILERITTAEQNFSEKRSAVDLLDKLKKK